MRYTFTGQLCGYICPEIEEPLANMTVRFYRPDPDSRGTVARATARPKETFTILENGDVEAKEDRLLAETETDDEGEFEIDLGEEEGYDGEALEIDVRTDHVPGDQHDDAGTLQFTLTTHQPRWRETEDGVVGRWEYCVEERFWCTVRERFGAWVICGTVTDCETEEPRSGLEVIAYDKDIIQPDDLGTATTDANGHFRIYYQRADFERVPFSLSPVELIGGPDVYFEVRDGSGTQLLVEDPSRGRDSGRENIGPCFHESLCVDLPPPPEDGGGGGGTVPMFTHVGTYNVRTQINANGYAQDGGDTLAFTGILPLRGALPPGGSGPPKEYRFRVENLSTGNVRTVDASMIAPTRIGMLQYYDTSGNVTKLRQETYTVNNSNAPNNVSVGSNGWIQVPTENDLGSVNRTGSGKFVRNTGNLIRLRTRQLIDEDFDLTAGPHVAGDSLDPGEKSSTHTYRLVFETRNVGGGSVRKDELAKIVISNSQYTQIRHPSWSGGRATTRGAVMLDIQEFRNANDGCIRLSNSLNALVTTYHDHINTARLRLEGANWSQCLIGSGQNCLRDLSHDEFSGSVNVPISSLSPCAYILWLDVSYDLTSGNGRVPGQHDHIAFCVSE